MPRTDANAQVFARPAVDAAFMPRLYAARPGADPLRALDFWVGQHPYDAPKAVAVEARESASAVQAATSSEARDRARAAKIAELAGMVPLLKQLAEDPRPSVRVTCATCFSILARAGQAPTDRDVWRVLLGLSKYDDESEVRAAAEAALVDLETFGTVARAS